MDRINTLIAVASTPGVFAEVEKWIKKLDIAVESSAGALNNYVYKVKYGFAPTIAMAIMGLYSVFLAIGQIAGSLIGGFASDAYAFDGILVATLILLLIALAPLFQLRSWEHRFTPAPGGPQPSPEQIAE